MRESGRGEAREGGGRRGGKLSRELERQKCVQDKRLRCSISRYSFCSPPLLPSRLFFFYPPLFVLSLSRAADGAPTLSSVFPPSPPPAASRALYSFHVSRVKLCAISLTFDNRCSSGNYIPSVLATNLLLHFSSPLLFKLAHTCALIFRSPPMDLQMYNPQEVKISSP